MWITDDNGREHDLDIYANLAQLREAAGRWITDETGREIDLDAFTTLSELRLGLEA
jgi:hypothetical protein